MPAQFPDVERRGVLADLTATSARLDAVKVHLFQNDIIPTGASVIGDFTAATFSGYAVSAVVVWGTPFMNDNGDAEVVGDLKQFNHNGGGTDNTIYGVYVTDSAGTGFKYAERFAEPIEMNGAEDCIPYLPRLNA